MCLAPLRAAGDDAKRTFNAYAKELLRVWEVIRLEHLEALGCNCLACMSVLMITITV